MVNLSSESLVATSVFFSYLNSDVHTAAREWKQTYVDTERDYTYCYDRVMSSTNVAQIESKLWIIEELKNLNVTPKTVVLLGGWFAQFTVPLLLEYGVDFVQNYEMDVDAKNISYKFNKRYKDAGKYKCDVVNIMFQTIHKKQEKLRNPFDTIINTSCEHMFPMKGFKTLNKGKLDDCLYVLQSTNEDKYDDHINCVESPEELAEQSEIKDIMYLGRKRLDSGMERFMVIGK